MNAEAARDPTRKRHSISEGAFPVRVRLLGGFGVWVGSRDVAEGAWHLRKAKSLVKLLVLAPGHTLHREQIMDLLWSHLGRRAASNNLRQALHVARRTLHPDPEIASRYLTLSGEQLTLCPEGQLWVDVEAFEGMRLRPSLCGDRRRIGRSSSSTRESSCRKIATRSGVGEPPPRAALYASTIASPDSSVIHWRMLLSCRRIGKAWRVGNVFL
jgi:hypothetical protein